MTATITAFSHGSKSTTIAPETSVELVDPDTAREWLGRNDRNRNLRKSTVEAYARDMENGRWQFTGDAIKFSTNGALLDGQHRLHALVQAGVELSMLVVRNLAPESQDVMDTGAKRSPGDVLSLHDEKSTVAMASLAAMIVNSGTAWSKKVTTAEIIDAVENDNTIRVVVADILPNLKLSHLLPPTVAAFAYWRLIQIDPFATAQFFESLASGANLPAGSPILALDRRLQNVGRSGRGSRAYRTTAMACIFSAWNAWREDRQVAKIQLSYDKAGRVQIPEPK